MKYLQIFEAFESKTLAEVLQFVNKAERGRFKNMIEELCDKLRFPMSRLSDDLFQYMFFDEALELAANIEDEPCENESETIPGERCSGPTGDENQGMIMRTWGRGKRKVKCDICNGTGFKPKTNFPIRWIKFWFDENGKYVTTTATDGKIRKPQSIDFDFPPLDDNIANYEIEEEGLDYTDFDRFNSGDYFYFRASDSNNTGSGVPEARKSDRYRVAMLWKEGRGNFMIQNVSSGSEPNVYYKKVAKNSWVITGSGDYRGDIKKLKYKLAEPKEVDIDKDPYTWNALVDLDYKVPKITTGDPKRKLENATFALVLDYVAMKNKFGEGVEDVDITKGRRELSKSGALALKTDAEIKSANFDRYIDKISKNLADKFQVKPGESVDSKASYLKLIFLRIFGYGYSGHYILQGLNFSDFKTIKDYILNALLNQDKFALERAVSNIESIMARNKRFNTNMKNNLDYLVQNCPDEEYSEKDAEGNVVKTYTRMDIIKKLMEVNRVIVYKINNSNLECLQDFDILFDKLKNIRENFRNNPAYEKCHQASNVNYYLEDDNLRQPLRYLRDIEVYQIPEIIENFDSLIKYINRA